VVDDAIRFVTEKRNDLSIAKHVINYVELGEEITTQNELHGNSKTTITHFE
jgi:hypothetical protein